MKSQLPFVLLGGIFLLGILFGCHHNKRNKAPEPEVVYSLVHPDWTEISERGSLTLLTENSSVSFYLYRGQGMGYDYEMVRAFGKDHELNVEVKLLDDLNAMFDRLNKGEADIIACNLTASQERDSIVTFTTPLTTTRQVLVQRNPTVTTEAAIARSWEELEGREVYVHAFSSFHQALKRLQKERGGGPTIIEASGSISSETLIRLVAEGQIDMTVADENMAQLNATYYPELDISMPITEAEPIAWAVRKDADSLLAVLNTWIEDPSTARKRNYLHHKYFKALKSQETRVRSPYSSLSGKQISEFDAYIKRYSADLSWDWRLLAALIYQESRFNPESRSWAGAFGLMQLMPATAERFGIDTSHTGAANIRAGVSYLKYLDRFWKKRVDDPDERVKFILASYNVGPGHIQDAMVIAEHIGKDSQRWFNNVEEALLLKGESDFRHLEGVRHGYCRPNETVKYVRNVLRKFAEYQSLE